MTGTNETGDEVGRRDVLKMLGAAGAAGTVGLSGIGTAAAAQTTPRTETVTTSAGNNVFLGGDFFELGIRPDGGFGTSISAPSSFFGSARGKIGMYADLDGFADTAGTQYRYDYFLPGTPEERWSVGYENANGMQFVGSNGNVAGANIPTTVTAATSGTTLAAEVESTFNNTLQVDQTYRFKPEARFFENLVTLTNVSNAPINRVRFQRSVDPDSGVDEGCSFATKNTIVRQPPTSDDALVRAELADNDSCALAQESSIPFFYYSQNDSARVASGSSSSGLAPSPVVYAPEDYENAPAEGTVKTEDVYVSITFDVGTIGPGESETVTFFQALTNDFDDTIDQIEGCIRRRDGSRENQEFCLTDRATRRDLSRGDGRVESENRRRRAESRDGTGGSTGSSSGSSGSTSSSSGSGGDSGGSTSGGGSRSGSSSRSGGDRGGSRDSSR